MAWHLLFPTKAIRLCGGPIWELKNFRRLIERFDGRGPGMAKIFTNPAPRPCSAASTCPFSPPTDSLKVSSAYSPLLSFFRLYQGIIPQIGQFCQQYFQHSGLSLSNNDIIEFYRPVSGDNPCLPCVQHPAFPPDTTGMHRLATRAFGANSIRRYRPIRCCRIQISVCRTDHNYVLFLFRQEKHQKKPT